MATYDPSVILAFTDKLYAEAENTVAIYMFIGVLVGAGVGAAVGNTAHIGLFLPALIGAALVGAVAFQGGRPKAFSFATSGAGCTVSSAD